MTLINKNIPSVSNSAYLFPGQGSQTVGMGKELFDSSSAAKDLLENIDQALGRNLTKIMFNGPEDELKKDHKCTASHYGNKFSMHKGNE